MGRLLVMALCAVALLQAVRPALHSARAGIRIVSDGSERAFLDQLEYLSDEFQRQVPVGARVAVVDEDAEWTMRLSELATLHGGIVVLAAEHPDLEVSRVSDPAAPHGIGLLTRRPVAR
ncbi:hypothetical protein ACFFX1_00360 [Dactylosporangium sucinum]|uniref:hypothetical protein n=1 Tax=Dactylosporangium sucinum TaxID=1424081 RepID=UPI00167DF707|nr:hypothetical protein [Dactylosporangium sucinum]